MKILFSFAFVFLLSVNFIFSQNKLGKTGNKMEFKGFLKSSISYEGELSFKIIDQNNQEIEFFMNTSSCTNDTFGIHCDISDTRYEKIFNKDITYGHGQYIYVCVKAISAYGYDPYSDCNRRNRRIVWRPKKVTQLF